MKADHFLGGQIRYETVDIDSQRGIFNIYLSIERSCQSYNSLLKEYPIKVLEYSSNKGYILSVYSAKLIDSSFTYFPCSLPSNSCSSASSQVIETKHYKVTILVPNSNKECIVYFDDNAIRTYSDNILDPSVPMILFTRFIPKYNNSQYQWIESKRHFPLRNKLAEINYLVSDVENDSIHIESSLPYTQLLYSLSNGNLSYSLTKASPKMGLNDNKPFWINESKISVASSSLSFTPSIAQNSWLTLTKSEYRKLTIGSKDTWVCISQSNSDRLIAVYDINSQFKLHSIESNHNNVHIDSQKITICHNHSTYPIAFKFPIEKNIQLSKWKTLLGIEDKTSTFSIQRNSGSSHDTIILSTNYSSLSDQDIQTLWKFEFEFCHSTFGIGFDKSVEVPMTLFNYNIFSTDTMLSCQMNFRIPLHSDKSISVNWGSTSVDNKFITIPIPKDTIIIAQLNSPNTFCPNKDSIYLNHGSLFSISTIGYSPSCYKYSDAKAKAFVSGSNGPYTFRWSNNATFDSISSINAGIHIVEVKDKDLCSQKDTLVINETKGITYNWITDTAITCYGGGNGAGHFEIISNLKPNQYLWDNSASIDSTLVQKSAGNYTGKFLYINDSNNACQQDYSIAILNPDSINLEIIVTNNTCFGETNGKMAIIPRGGHEGYEFYIDGQYKPSGFLSDLASDTFMIQVIDAKQCSTSLVPAIVSSPTRLNFNVELSRPSCPEVSNGIISIDHSQGGVSPYTYSLNYSPFESNSNFYSLHVGFYTIQIKDANHCVQNKNYTLNPLYYLQANSLHEHSRCPQSHSGKIQLSITNGKAPYDAWINIDSNQYQGNNIIYQQLSKGKYPILIKDGNGCLWRDTFQINEPDSLNIEVSVKNESCYLSKDGSLSILSRNGGTEPFKTAQWFDAQNTLLASSNMLAGGRYKLLLEDNVGCTYSREYTILSKPIFKTSISESKKISCFQYEDGKIIANTIGGTAPLSYFWNGVASTSNSLENIKSGKYNLVIQDSDGCEAKDSILLNEPPAILLENLKFKHSDCPNSKNGAITIQCSYNSSSQNLYYKLKNISDYLASNSFTNLDSGHYTILVKNDKNCEQEFNVSLLIDKTIDIYLPPNLYFEIGSVNTIQPNISFGTNTTAIDLKSINWTPPYGLSCIDCMQPNYHASKTNPYTLTVGYGNGCSAKFSSIFNVSKPEDLFIPNSFSPNGDNKNDLWMVYGKNIKSISIKIFNRVGEMVFHSNEISKGWDGNFRGKAEPAAVFNYIVKAEYADESTKTFEGSLHLFR